MREISSSNNQSSVHAVAPPAIRNRRLIIFANGNLPSIDAARALLRPGDRILCADAGARHARRLGVLPDLVVGDMDSIAEEDRDWLNANRVQLIPYPHDKDQTDLELAVQLGLSGDPAQIIIVAALGARLDHTLGNIALLADERLADVPCSLDDGVEQVILCRARTEIHGSHGNLVSLVPWGVPVTGVRTSGLKWPVRGEILHREKSRGISNEMTAESAEIRIESGMLLVVHRREQPDASTGL